MKFGNSGLFYRTWTFNVFASIVRSVLFCSQIAPVLSDTYNECGIWVHLKMLLLGVFLTLIMTQFKTNRKKREKKKLCNAVTFFLYKLMIFPTFGRKRPIFTRLISKQIFLYSSVTLWIQGFFYFTNNNPSFSVIQIQLFQYSWKLIKTNKRSWPLLI